MHEGGTIDIIKRNGRRPTEAFNPDKLRRSLEAACLSAGCMPGQAESIARAVTQEVAEWIQNRPEVTSNDIRLVAARHLKNHHPGTAYLYEQHRLTL